MCGRSDLAGWVGARTRKSPSIFSNQRSSTLTKPNVVSVQLKMMVKILLKAAVLNCLRACSRSLSLNLISANMLAGKVTDSSWLMASRCRPNVMCGFPGDPYFDSLLRGGAVAAGAPVEVGACYRSGTGRARRTCHGLHSTR